MIDIRRPSPEHTSHFGRLWRLFLPVAIAVMVLAVVTGIGDDTSRPAWMFAGGIFIALIGAASLLSHLLDLGRRRARELEKRLEDRLDQTGSRSP